MYKIHIVSNLLQIKTLCGKQFSIGMEIQENNYTRPDRDYCKICNKNYLNLTYDSKWGIADEVLCSIIYFFEGISNLNLKRNKIFNSRFEWAEYSIHKAAPALWCTNHYQYWNFNLASKIICEINKNKKFNISEICKKLAEEFLDEMEWLIDEFSLNLNSFSQREEMRKRIAAKNTKKQTNKKGRTKTNKNSE